MAAYPNAGSAVYDAMKRLFPDSVPAYTTVNTAVDRDLDGSTLTVDGVADVLGTLIQDLQARGLLD